MKRLALALLLAATPAFANPGPGTKVVQQANDDIAKELKNKAPSSAVVQSVNTLVDIDAMGKNAIGPTEWAKLTTSEQQQFLQALHALIEANYLKGVSANPSYTVRYTGESTTATGNVLVTTEIDAQKKGRPVTFHIDYELEQQGKNLRAIEIITDGVGTVANYNTEFSKILAQGGIKALLTKMNTKLQSMQAAVLGSGSTP